VFFFFFFTLSTLIKINQLNHNNFKANNEREEEAVKVNKE